ncbi:putative amino-acid metabolite efflux pump [Hartmannibacter diazotrophicus]|uniref:Putative amino-acid metabolite efflux pump n=1 Tax=Hartmannibacter diazotrophicus TaxID=1482074 RepID=A0A2C9DB04_9HYPH|nr:DMT family transporter [Hartmannibacter diazotrophicus]SON57504.1 putative amino-acid metabolite efflux pump [Hartmannibacter diazotrophicus]
MNTASQTTTPTGTEGDRLILRVAPMTFVVLWSTGFIAAKYAAPVAGPFSLLFLRMAFVIPALGLIALVYSKRRPSPRIALHAMVAGIMIHAAYLGGMFFAIKHGLPAGFAGLVVGLQPMLTAIFARPVLGERLSRAHLIGLALGLVGAAMVVVPKLDPSAANSVTPMAILIAIGAVAMAALGTIYQKRFVSGADLLSSTVLQYVGATLALLPLAAAEGFHYVPGLQLVAVVAWLAIVLSIISVLLLMLMIREGAVSKVAALFYLVPPTTAAMAWVLFGEALTIVQMAGTALVALAVALATRKT